MIDSCLGCGQQGLRRVRPYRTDSRHGRNVLGGSWLYECSGCGLVQAAPRPDARELNDYYSVDYRRAGYYGSDVADPTAFPKDNLFYYNRGQSIADLVAPRVRAESPRILDIGAGFGHILYALGERFPKSRRTAIEFSGVAARHLQSIGVDVITEPVENVLPRMEGQFDVVVISHVLEHLLDPGAVLKLIRSSLAPNGVLYVEVPNIPADSLLRFPDHVWAPRFDEPHITFFSTGSLHTLLESRGLIALFCDTAGPFYRYISSLRFRMPTARWFIQHKMPPALFHFLRRQSFTKPVRMREREESFYQYGGCRIWIRSISQAGAAAE